MAYRGKYKVKVPDKYLGDPSKVTYRSSWEYEVFKFFEQSNKIVSWASEEIIIPDLDHKGQKHRYFPDVYFEHANGKKYLVEIKPLAQTRPPKEGKSKRRFIKEQIRYKINQNKWIAAKDFCDRHGLVWMVWTEKDLIKNLGLNLKY